MYYLLWIGESADELRAPHCEIATNTKYSMYNYCKTLIDKYYPEGQYVVMYVKTIPNVSSITGNRVTVFSQVTKSVFEFITDYEYDGKIKKEKINHEV